MTFQLTRIKYFSDRLVLVILSFYALFIRFPFFFRDYIDRDESTFILMGQSWVDGHLPYTELWDIKPPLTFLFFATIIYLFGKSFLAIRLLGTILVIISSFYAYKLGTKFYSKKYALTIGLLGVILQSLFGSLQGVMSEHLAMAFFMPSVWLLINDPKKNLIFLVSGILMGIVLMIKLNMAYAALFIGIYLAFRLLKNKKMVDFLLKSSLYGIGILLVIGLSFLPYYFAQESSLWWKSVILAPLAYSEARVYSSFKLLFYIIPILAFLIIGWRKKLFDFKKPEQAILAVAVVGILLSFFKSGRINGHYLILLYPVFLPLLGFVFSEYGKYYGKKLLIKIVPYFLILVPVESYLEYVNIFRTKIERGTFFNGEGISVPKYIKENNIDTHNILFFGYHIGYWMLDTKPPTKAATQPSNILKDEMFFAYDNPRKTGLEELRYIMETIKPKTVVVRKGRRIFDKDEVAENEYIDAYLAMHYRVAATVEKAEILQRTVSSDQLAVGSYQITGKLGAISKIIN